MGTKSQDRGGGLFTGAMTNGSLLAGLLLAFCFPARGQEFAIRQIELSADLLTLHYDLIDTVKDHTYSVYVYSSKDNFLSPLEKIYGDAGLEVRPGKNRKIAWNAREELGPLFKGEVQLEIRGRLYIPFIRFEGFKEIEARKRAVPFLVKWSGGTRQNILNFQLYQGDGKLKYTFPNAPNNSEYRITIPSNIRPGEGYYFKISDTKNKDQVVLTPTFRIKRRYPLASKVAAALVIAGAAYYLLPDPGDEPIDGPPLTP